MAEIECSNSKRMGRRFVCPETGLKRGAWTPEEDMLLSNYIKRYGSWNWREIPKFAGLSRCGKSCRLRWLNYLQPNIKRGNYNKEEEELITNLHKKLGNKWSAIAANLPGRTDNEIKNYWHTHIEKRHARSTKRKWKAVKYETQNDASLDDSCPPEVTLKLAKCETKEDSSNSGNSITLEILVNPQQPPKNACSVTLLTSGFGNNLTLERSADTQKLPGNSCDMSPVIANYEAPNIASPTIKDKIEISSDGVFESYRHFWSEPFLLEVAEPVICVSPFKQSFCSYDMFNDYDMDWIFNS